MSYTAPPTAPTVPSTPPTASAPSSPQTADMFGLGGGTAAAPTATAPTAGTPAAQPIFPGSSLSPYFMSQIGGNPVNLGAGLPGGGSMTISQALSWFQTLPQSQVLQIESVLWEAGFYTDANGNPTQTAPALGSHDDQSNRAFLNALLQASDSGQSVTDTINTSIQSGVGANNRATLPQAVSGGGNTYTIDLSNPADVQYGANQVFQAALGRNASADEVAKITANLRSQQTSQGLTKEQGAEQSAQESYQAKVDQRNIAFQFETTPKIALGAVPSGPIGDPAQWAVTLLQYMGDPVTSSNVQFLTGWAAKNGGAAGFNPIGAQNVTPGAQPGKGGAQYVSWAQSLQATSEALLSGPYANIVAALQSGDAASSASGGSVQAELQKWSGGSYKDITGQVKGAASQATAAVQAAAQTSQQPPPGGPGSAGQNATAQSMGAEGGGPNGPGAVTATLQAGATDPAVGAYLKSGEAQSTPAADVNPGQVETNPGDAYVNPTTVYSVNPASEQAQALQEATTGPNRIAYAGNNYLNAYQAILSMIKSGGPTG